MTRLALATLMCALGTTQASAQTVVSQGLLELDDEERNACFTLILRDTTGGVIRSSERYSPEPSWVWMNGKRSAKPNAYSISVLVESDETTITSLTCRELLATSKRLLRRAGQQEQSGRLSDQLSGRTPLKAGARA